MRWIKAFSKEESGYALPLAILGVATFTIIAFTYMSILTHEVKTSNELLNKWQARYVAEAGVEDALYNIKIAIQNNNSAYTLDLAQQAFGSDGNWLLPVTPHSGEVVSGTLYGTDNTTIVGTYRWSIVDFPSTNQTEPETLKNQITIDATSEYWLRSKDGLELKDKVGNQIVRNGHVIATVWVTFFPALIPDSPVRIEFDSFQVVN